MAHWIESRLPFLDHRVVEHCFRLGDAYKVNAGQTKAVLRGYLNSVGQQAIARRQRKMGYPTPTNEWMAREGGSALKGLLLDRGARIRRYVDAARLQALIERHVSGGFAAGDILFGLVCTELWLQECVDCSA